VLAGLQRNLLTVPFASPPVIFASDILQSAEPMTAL
jgi:hypothetical protein